MKVARSPDCASSEEESHPCSGKVNVFFDDIPSDDLKRVVQKLSVRRTVHVTHEVALLDVDDTNSDEDQVIIVIESHFRKKICIGFMFTRFDNSITSLIIFI